MYDIIGDIHGHADTLEQLLQKLGYGKTNGYYSHPERKVIFVGDYIDRGPKIREALEIVKAMAENDQAIAIMGNHEFNAILYNLQDKDGNYFRPHTQKNYEQHAETLEAFKDKTVYQHYLEWFKTLPLFFEDESIRVVHACWDEEHIAFLRQFVPSNTLTDQVLLDEYRPGTRFYEALEITLKGKELPMPEGLTFKDKAGHERSELRIRWWMNPEQVTYKQYSVEAYDNLADTLVPAELTEGTKAYCGTEKPVFFGHYWLPGSAELSVFAQNVCCVDYSVAKQGKLVAYRWNGEACLDHRNMHHI